MKVISLKKRIEKHCMIHLYNRILYSLKKILVYTIRVSLTNIILNERRVIPRIHTLQFYLLKVQKEENNLG